MVIVPGGADRLSAALAQAIWVSSQSGRLPETLALWVVRELAVSDAVVAAAFTPEGSTRLPHQEPEVGTESRQGCGEAIAPALVQALTDVLYALDRVDRGLGDQAAVEWELARARWALLGLLARTYVAIEELLTPAAKQLGQLGVTVLGRGSGRNIWLVEAV